MAKFDWDKFLSDRRTQTAMAGIGSTALARALGLGWLPSLGIGAGVGGLYYGGTKWWDDRQKKYWDDQQKKSWDAYNDYMVNDGGARVDSALSDSGQPNEELPEYADLNKQRQDAEAKQEEEDYRAMTRADLEYSREQDRRAKSEQDFRDASLKALADMVRKNQQMAGRQLQESNEREQLDRFRREYQEAADDRYLKEITAAFNKQRQEEAGTDASEAGQDIDVPYTNYNGLGLGLTQDNEALPKHLTNPDSTFPRTQPLSVVSQETKKQRRRRELEAERKRRTAAAAAAARAQLRQQDRERAINYYNQISGY